jgi:hypothetical protein
MLRLAIETRVAGVGELYPFHILFGLDLSRTDPLALALAILITTFSTSGLGLLLGCISLVSLETMFINNTAYFLLLIFSGANIPLAQLPGWMQKISWALPLTRGIAAARALIDGQWKQVRLLAHGYPPSESESIGRILDFFPADERDQIRRQIAATLQAVICQRMVNTVTGGVTPAFEIMINTPTVHKLIEENRLEKLAAAMYFGLDRQSFQIRQDTCNSHSTRRRT